MPGINNWLTTNLAHDIDNCASPFAVQFNLNGLDIDLNFELASDNTAKLIANTYKDLHLCFSGGLDSEYVASVLVRNKIEFTPVILIVDSLSAVDSWWALHFCNQNNLTPKVFDFRQHPDEIVKILLKHSLQFKLPYNSGLFATAVADIIGTGSVLTGCGEYIPVPSTYDEPIGDAVAILECDYYTDLTPGHPGAFFSFTPSMCFSLLDAIDRNKNTQAAKAELFDLEFRAKIPIGFRSITPTNLVPLVNKMIKPEPWRWVHKSWKQISESLKLHK